MKDVSGDTSMTVKHNRSLDGDLCLSTPPKPDQETQEGPRAGAFLRLLLMHFYSGLLTYFLSGVDREVG
jgi:hypothetical protein